MNPNPTYNEDLKARQEIHREAVRKALDLPKEDDVITVDNSQRIGIDWKSLAALAVVGVSLLGGGGLAAFAVTQLTAVPVLTAPPLAAPPAEPADSEYEVLFYDRQGRHIDVQPLSSWSGAQDDDEG